VFYNQASAMENIHCYAQRLLNPLRGTLQTIAYVSCQAVSTDGMHWDIYVRNDELVADLENSYSVQTSDIRYGSWSGDRGLKRGPVFPSDDFNRMEEMGAVVYEHLLPAHRQVPCPCRIARSNSSSAIAAVIICNRVQL
jgi:hypothetical protein